MNTLLSLIGNPSYIWIPMVTAGAIIFISFWFGFMNGLASSVYFLTWTIAGILMGVLIGKYILDFVKDKVNSSLGENYENTVNALFDKHRGLLVSLLVLSFVATCNLLGMSIYWFFRKKLRRKMIENKDMGEGNLKRRFLGSGISVLYGFTTAIFATNTAAVMTTSNSFTRINSKIFHYSTFTLYDGTEGGESLKNILLLIDRISKDNVDYSDIIYALVSGRSNDLNTDVSNQESRKKVWDDHKDLFTDVINNDISPILLKDLLPDLVGEKEDQVIYNIDELHIKGLFNKDGILQDSDKLALTADGRANLQKSLEYFYLGDKNSEGVYPDAKKMKNNSNPSLDMNDPDDEKILQDTLGEFINEVAIV